MENIFNTLVKVTLGTMVLTREKAEKLVQELAKKGAVNKGEAKKILNDLARKGEHSEKELRKQAIKVITAVMKKFDVPTRREINALKAEIAALKKSKRRSRKKK